MSSHARALGAILLLSFNALGLRVHENDALSTNLAANGTGYRSFQAGDGDGCGCGGCHPSDLYKPIIEVSRAHPGQDLNCWFNFYASWLGQPTNFVDFFRNTVAQFTPPTHGPEGKLHLPTGEVVTTHNDNMWGDYSYDDGMCYLMGWLKGQGRLDEDLMKMKSVEEWYQVTERECARLPPMLNESSEALARSEKMTIGYMVDDNERINQASNCLWKDYDATCKRATIQDYAMHLYPKCLLGANNRLTGAAGQIAWCYARACVTEEGIKHGAECWPEGLPNFS